MFQKTLCRKSCYEGPTKYRPDGGVCIFKIAGMHVFKGSMKTLILLFTKVANENTESISRDLYKL